MKNTKYYLSDKTERVRKNAAIYIGELERLGKDGQDILVLGLHTKGFENLSVQQKKLCYFLYRAAIAGNDIFTQQTHRYALEIRDMVEQIYLYSKGLPEPIVDGIHDYLKYLWIHHCQYSGETYVKYAPNYINFAQLKEAAEHAVRNGAFIQPLKGETLSQKLERLRPHIFETEVEHLLLNQKEGDDILATSYINLYHPDITQSMFNKVPSEWKGRLNVYFNWDGNQITPELYKIGGLYGQYLATVAYWIEQALPYAESEEQKQSLQELLHYYQTGNEESFRAHCVHWVHTDTVVDYLNGFIEQYYDPRGVIGQYEANVNYRSDSTLISRLAVNAGYFEKHMPWPDQYKRDHCNLPVANVVQVIMETGDSGPSSPLAYNLPNYADINREVGSKNVIMLNVEEAASEKVREAIIQEFYLPKHQDAYRKYGKLGRRWEVYMHEVIGHGSGKPDARFQGGDPGMALGRTYSALEECRADLVALYHIFDPKLVEIGAFQESEQREVVEAVYVGYFQGHMTRYRSLQDNIVREAHRKGSEMIMRYLVEGGEDRKKNFGVRVVHDGGKYFVEVYDLLKARQGVAELLQKLQIIKSTGDAEGAAKLFDRFATYVNEDWVNNIKHRSQSLKIPRETAYVFPQLVPVFQNDEIVDVRLENKEDLTDQQLRFSRWRFNTELWPRI